MIILGIDLAAKEYRPTGYYYKNSEEKYGILYKDSEILNLIKNLGPNIIIFDSPISYEYPYRIEEKYLYEHNFHPLPLSMKYMKELTYRAMNIINKIKNLNIEIYESFPRAVEKILNINKEYYMKIFKIDHIYDAFLCYLSGLYYYNGKYIKIRNLILPKI